MAESKTHRELQVEQIRPLLFAIAMRFDIREARRALRLMVSWSVRFLVVGGRGGKLDRHYGLRAQEIGTGSIGTAEELVTAMAEVVPGDAVFKAAFEDTRISRPYVARYYLRALEQAINEQAEPEHVPNDNETEVNLEHIMPENLDHPGWAHIRSEVATAYFKRLGNMVLLPYTLNRYLGNKPFAEKKEVFGQSNYTLTREVAQYSVWDDATIKERQRRLADLAVHTWPIEVSQ